MIRKVKISVHNYKKKYLSKIRFDEPLNFTQKIDTCSKPKLRQITILIGPMQIVLVKTTRGRYSKFLLRKALSIQRI